MPNTFGGSGTSTSFSSTGGSPTLGNSGESTSTSFVLDSGPLNSGSFSPASQNWRWYDDPDDETPISPSAAENVAPSNIKNMTTLKLRVSVAELAGIGASGVKFALQYATSSDFSSDAHTVAEAGSCTGSSGFCYATTTGGGADNAIITTGLLSDSDACSGSVGAGCGTHNTSGTTTSTFTQQASTTTEYEFTIESSGAAADTAYFFRVFYTNGSTSVPINTGASYPSLVTGGATLSFSIGGVSSSTTIGGVSTNIDTSSTNVDFGSLNFGVPVAGAQRFTVSTNAANGYEIFAFQQQGLLGTRSNEIQPVTGTNPSPLGWSSGCSGSAPSCYGYHTGAAVLAGGSTRFAPDDTYAQFTTTPAEVAYSSGPVSDNSTDILYRLEATNQQPADGYSTSIVYVVVPTF